MSIGLSLQVYSCTSVLLNDSPCVMSGTTKKLWLELKQLVVNVLNLHTSQIVLLGVAVSPIN